MKRKTNENEEQTLCVMNMSLPSLLFLQKTQKMELDLTALRPPAPPEPTEPTEPTEPPEPPEPGGVPCRDPQRAEGVNAPAPRGLRLAPRASAGAKLATVG